MKKWIAVILVLLLSCPLMGQTATNITGLYNTGQTSSDTLISAGTQVQSNATQPTLTSGWYVTYSSINGGKNIDTNLMGDAYAISPSAIQNSAYTQNTSNAEWVTAPGASTQATGGTINTGGNYLPGNGTTGRNAATFIYTIAFDITGTGPIGTLITNSVSINMTLAADDGYSVYVNPIGANVNPIGHSVTDFGPSAVSNVQGGWSNTINTSLLNNINVVEYYIGMNYISVVVDNSNSIAGSSNSTTWNASGLLAYNTTSDINGDPVWGEGSPVPEPKFYGLFAMVLMFCGYGWKKFHEHKKVQQTTGSGT